MARRMSRFIHFAMAAGKEAVADSGHRLRGDDPRSSATASASSSTPAAAASSRSSTAPTSTTRRARASSRRSRSRRCRARWAPAMLSMEYGLTGPVITQVAACATSVIAFHDALRLIRDGECDVVLDRRHRGADLADGRRRAREHDARSRSATTHPRRASRPFDLTRDGFVLGEGAGVVVVESLAHALERGATPIAEIIGGALTADAFHISAPEPTGRGQARAMTKALRNAGIAPDEVDYIVAHGTATPLNDVTETRAIKAAYGDHAYKVAISSPEVDDRPSRRRGRDRAARSPAIGAIRDQVIPPTANLHTPDPECDLDYVPLTRARGQGRHGRRRRLRLRRPERGRRSSGASRLTLCQRQRGRALEGLDGRDESVVERGRRLDSCSRSGPAPIR